MKYGEILKKLRTENGLSQQELTDRLTINRSTYARYETSSTQPDYETLERIADYYNVTIDYLLGRSSHPKLSAERDKDVNKEVEELMKLLQAMPDEKRKEMEARILAYAQGLADANSD